MTTPRPFELIDDSHEHASLSDDDRADLVVFHRIHTLLDTFATSERPSSLVVRCSANWNYVGQMGNNVRARYVKAGDDRPLSVDGDLLKSAQARDDDAAQIMVVPMRKAESRARRMSR